MSQCKAGRWAALCLVVGVVGCASSTSPNASNPIAGDAATITESDVVVAGDTAATADAATIADVQRAADTSSPGDVVGAGDAETGGDVGGQDAAPDASQAPDTPRGADSAAVTDAAAAADTAPSTDTAPSIDTASSIDAAASKGACDNPADLQALAKADPEKAIGGCVSKCFTPGPNCTGCLKTGLGTSDGCTACFAGIVDCTVKNCALLCINAGSKGCADCQQLKCFPAFEQCSGVSPP